MPTARTAGCTRSARGTRGVFTAPAQSLFLILAIGAAYTPLSLQYNGRVLTQNDGHLFVVGED